MTAAFNRDGKLRFEPSCTKPFSISTATEDIQTPNPPLLQTGSNSGFGESFSSACSINIHQLHRVNLFTKFNPVICRYNVYQIEKDVWMTEDTKKGIVNRVIDGIASTTLLMYLLMFSVFLFPRIVICILAAAAVPFLFRYLPKYRKTSQNES